MYTVLGSRALGGGIAFDPTPDCCGDEQNDADDREPQQAFRDKAHDDEHELENQKKTYETQHVYISTRPQKAAHPHCRTVRRQPRPVGESFLCENRRHAAAEAKRYRSAAV